jgi:hypothetical protein
MRDDMSAIARGLEDNASVEKLKFTELRMVRSILHGPAWQAMLQRNCFLKEMVLSYPRHGPRGEILSDDFAYFAKGLARNTSLKSLDLGNQFSGNASIAAMVAALGCNDTLESLVLHYCISEGREGAVAIQNMWRNQTLRHLDLSDDSIGYDRAVMEFPTYLSRNCVFETLCLRNVGLQSRQCRAICESLQGNSRLRELDLGHNHISLDVDCATALNNLLDSTTLRVLKFNFNCLTNKGIELLARGLQGNSSLVELDLQDCDIGDAGLLKLGELLVENSTLEILRLRDDFGRVGVSQFFQLLPRMEGLKELCLNYCGGIVNEELCVTLVDGLRNNTGLQRLTCAGGDLSWYQHAPAHVKPLIYFYLHLNRNGRKWLEAPLASRVPVGLWPHILAKMSSPKDNSLLYYFLRKKPSLVVE